MRQLTIISAFAIAAATQLAGATPAHDSEPLAQEYVREEKQDFAKAQALLKNQEPEDALEIIHQYRAEMESQSPQGLRWLELFIQASVDTKDVNQLVILFEFFPEIFKEHEEASLLVADAYINTNKIKNYQKIRSLWSDRETKVAPWFLLDTDRMLLEGNHAEAIHALQSRSFNNKADVGRLVRLALLYSNEDPKKAWVYLAEAYGKDPLNYDVRSYRAKLLESAGKNALAHQEYQAAARINPSNLFLKDQLVDFYLRHRQYSMALDLLQSSLTPPSLENLWVKTLFWGKVVSPSDFDWTDTPIPDGAMNPLIRFLIDLSPNQFWDQTTFSRLADAGHYLKTRQETFWLRVLQQLKDKNEAEADKLLRYNPFVTTSWYPQLEIALKRVLNYRKNNTLKVDAAQIPPADILHKLPAETTPAFFEELEQWAQSNEEIPNSLHNLLTGKEAFASIFLAAGWSEAALDLHVLPVIPNNYPDWLAPAMTRALYHNRSSVDANEFAALQKQTPQLQLLKAEITLAGGDKASALKEFLALAKDDSETGYRAAQLASLIYIEQQEYQNAGTTVNSQPRLVQDVLGQELLARIAHLEGNQTLADRLYRSIEQKSSEARSYLARKAFQEQDWERARTLTEQLINDYPENSTLKENLKKIKERQEQS